jgi:hypothetical protein
MSREIYLGDAVYGLRRGLPDCRREAGVIGREDVVGPELTRTRLLPVSNHGDHSRAIARRHLLAGRSMASSAGTTTNSAAVPNGR